MQNTTFNHRNRLRCPRICQLMGSEEYWNHQYHRLLPQELQNDRPRSIAHASSQPGTILGGTRICLHGLCYVDLLGSVPITLNINTNEAHFKKQSVKDRQFPMKRPFTGAYLLSLASFWSANCAHMLNLFFFFRQFSGDTRCVASANKKILHCFLFRFQKIFWITQKLPGLANGDEDCGTWRIPTWSVYLSNLWNVESWPAS